MFKQFPSTEALSQVFSKELSRFPIFCTFMLFFKDALQIFQFSHNFHYSSKIFIHFPISSKIPIVLKCLSIFTIFPNFYKFTKTSLNFPILPKFPSIISSFHFLKNSHFLTTGLPQKGSQLKVYQKGKPSYNFIQKGSKLGACVKHERRH